MANPEHVEILKQGVQVWNAWRKNNPDLKPDLSSANFRETDLSWVNLDGSNLVSTDFVRAHIIGGRFKDADLSRAYFNEANLLWADFDNTKLLRANLSGANLGHAHLIGADLTGANLSEVNFSRADISKANLTGVFLEQAILVDTVLIGSNLTNCNIFGIAAWNVNLTDTRQFNLAITRHDEAEITVDNLAVAQFIYLLLNNKEIRNVIDTITSKVVLILGRFTDERKAVLDAIREELRKRDYLPILFDFDPSDNRDLTETIVTLAGMSRFVIVDLSDPHSSPHEMMIFAEKLPSIPVAPIFCPVEAHPNPYPMLEHFDLYDWVLDVYEYESLEQLLPSLIEQVIAPAEAKLEQLREKKEQKQRRRKKNYGRQARN